MRGLRISFDVLTESRFVWLTAKIYNVRGELVRVITELEPVYSTGSGKGDDESDEIILYWDGKTDHNRMAANGRYFFHLKISDTEAETFSTQKMATFVLVK